MREDNKQKRNTKNIIKIVLIILYQVLVVMALILTMVIILQKVTNSNGSIGGYKIFRVITGSMEPEYEVGEVVISKEVDPKEIQVGDDIVYLGKIGEYAGKIIMHNVIEIDTNENGKLSFHAKGLQSNSVEDPQISEEQVYGVVKYKSTMLTILYNLATNIYSIFFIVIILVLNVFIAFNTPKKTKKRKVKRIANIDNDTDETFYDEEIEDNIEEFEEEENDDTEEIYDTSDDENMEEEAEEDNQQDVEKMIHDKMIHDKMMQMLNSDKKVNIKKNTSVKTTTKKNTSTNTQKKKGENRKNK